MRRRSLKCEKRGLNSPGSGLPVSQTGSWWAEVDEARCGSISTVIGSPAIVMMRLESGKARFSHLSPRGLPLFSSFAFPFPVIPALLVLRGQDSVGVTILAPDRCPLPSPGVLLANGGRMELPTRRWPRAFGTCGGGQLLDGSLRQRSRPRPPKAVTWQEIPRRGPARGPASRDGPLRLGKENAAHSADGCTPNGTRRGEVLLSPLAQQGRLSPACQWAQTN
jgi:hypothetical protein